YAQHVTLLEREHELDTLSRVLAMARSGGGGAVAVTGEPGAGKTALVDQALDRTGGLRVLRGGCDPLATPRPLGPFRDLATELGSLDLGGSLAEVCESVYAALRSQPTVLVVEDLHWVDAASVEVLRFLVRRVEPAPVAVVVIYRDDEVGRPTRRAPCSATSPCSTTSRHSVSTGSASGRSRCCSPAARWRPGASMRSPAATPSSSPWSPRNRTGRCPGPSATPSSRGPPASPKTTSRSCSWRPRPPDRLHDRVLPALGVDLPTLRRLFDTGLLLRNRRGLVFRHELARLAVESTIPVGGAARLHARLIDALEEIDQRDPAVLTHHAVAAADARRAAAYAQAAADEAAGSGSHTEVVAFLTIALDHVNGSDPRGRARLLNQLGAADRDALAEPHRLSLEGHHEEAAAWWRKAGAVFEEAMARTDSHGVQCRIDGIEQLDLLGAVVTADRLRRVLRQEGVTQLPQRPWSSTRANPSGMTNRQLDVAKLVARGLTNAEIAERLYISPKTTEHHVSAVLTKLGMANRRSVVVRAGELGLA
ncbi:MAG: AAA family ATPase, partial [Lapillicoccus sp.]